MTTRIEVRSWGLLFLLGSLVACGGASSVAPAAAARDAIGVDARESGVPDRADEDLRDVRDQATTDGGTRDSATAADASVGDAGRESVPDAPDGAGCISCVREQFTDPTKYLAVKQQLRFQIVGAAYDYSSDNIKSAYDDWSDVRGVIPNKPDFLDALEEGAAWLATADRFEDLRQPSTAMSPDGNGSTTEDTDTATPYYYVPLEHAWKVFVWWTAHEVALEMAGALPWSLVDANPDLMAPLLDSTEMMHRRIIDDVGLGHAPHSNDVGKPHSSYLGMTIIGAPRYTFRWLVQEGIIKSTRRKTITALLDWVGANFVHFEGYSQRIVCQDHWGHRYFPTVEMLIEGTTRASDGKFAHWTMGCHGTVQFIKDVLRAVNIPVRLAYNCEHAEILFVSEDAYMTHGDHPYNSAFRSSGCSTDYLLLDRPQWERLFGPGQVNHQDPTLCDATPSPVAYSSLPEILATCPQP